MVKKYFAALVVATLSLGLVTQVSAESPFKVSADRCKTNENLRCMMKRNDKPLTIEDYQRFSRKGIDDFRKLNGWSQSVKLNTVVPNGAWIAFSGKM